MILSYLALFDVQTHINNMFSNYKSASICEAFTLLLGDAASMLSLMGWEVMAAFKNSKMHPQI